MRLPLAGVAMCVVLFASACAAELPTATPGASAAPSSRPTNTTGASSSAGPGTPSPAATPSVGPTEPGATPTASPPPTASPSLLPGVFDATKVRLALESVAIFDLSSPVYVANAGDGTHRLFIVEIGGLVRILEPNGSIDATPLLDLRDRVNNAGEQGLYSIAFHPDFASNGKFYVHWTDAQSRSYIQEYTVGENGIANPDSERTLLQIDHPQTNHKGGWMDFGPDGYLYIAVGDGGGSSPGDPYRNGQDTTDLLGNILRIDVDHGDPYAIPSDNPFADGADGAKPEIWAFGLRNPWRASFDRETGDLWIGDVGQDKREEIDVIPTSQGGLNFGWSDMEGTSCHRRADCNQNGLTLPVAEYSHERGYCSVTGGYVYRGAAYPFLDGAYIYSDFCNGNLFAFDAATAVTTGAATPGGRKVGTINYNVVSMGEDEDGE
ncbi:MAG: PQQ-dependent sugar dehydrogenase, partial [Candidatus Limnocylindrales bacterium]